MGRGSRAAGRGERFIPHDGRMNTPLRLARGLPLLGRIHSRLADTDVSAAGRAAEFANHIEPGCVLADTRAGRAAAKGGRPTRRHRACPASGPTIRLRWPILRRAHRAHWMP